MLNVFALKFKNDGKNKSNLDSNLPAQICRLINLHLLFESFKLVSIN